MAKSKRRMTTGSGPPPRESPRRAAHAPTPPPPQRPPTGGATQPVPAPRPLVPAQSERSGGGWLSVLGSHRVVIAVSTLVVIAALGILVYAWYDQTVKPRRALALQVGDQRYSMEYFSKRYKQAIEDPANANSLRTSLFTGLPERVADTLETDSIVLQRADALGITASNNQIDREMLTRLGVPVITDTPEGAEITDDDSFTVQPYMEAQVRTQLQQFGYTLAEYREIARAQLLRSKVGDYFKEEVPTRAPQVRVRLLQFPSESDARIAIQKIKSGESTFQELAETVSLDRAGKGKGGERDWLARGILPAGVDDVAFSQPVNTLSEPINAGEQAGWILVETLERSDERDMSDELRRQLADKSFSDWLVQQRESLQVKRELNEKKIRWAFSHSGATVPESAARTPQSPAAQPPVQPAASPAATP